MGDWFPVSSYNGNYIPARVQNVKATGCQNEALPGAQSECIVGAMPGEDPMLRTAGINHIAMVCRDMRETVKFYTQVLGMPLVKTVQLPDGGQHFFFDCGGGSSVAFFWWKDGPEAAPGIASVKSFPYDARTAVGSMNHLAFHLEEGELEAALTRLQEAGVPHTPAVVNHDDSELGVSREMHEGVFVRSVYFTDPNGIMLEFAAFTKEFGPEDVRHQPATVDA
jgi:catechol 2,3-dioxygenase-like lactoylglutathione lyase family enzyme